MNHQYLQRFRQNRIGNDYIIGDIHGRYALLTQTLKEINFNPATDRLFGVGDLVDRGEDHRSVVALLAKPWFHSTRGNHDQFIIDQFDSERIMLAKGYDKVTPQQIHLDLEGRWFYSLPRQEKIWFYRHLKQLPYAIEIETQNGIIGICHAGVPANMSSWQEFTSALPDRDIREKAIRWRKAAKLDDRHVKGILQTYHGHTSQSGIKKIGNSFFIDTFEKTNKFTVVKIN